MSKIQVIFLLFGPNASTKILSSYSEFLTNLDRLCKSIVFPKIKK